MSFTTENDPPNEAQTGQTSQAKLYEPLHLPRWLMWAISPHNNQLTFLAHVVLTASLTVLALGSYWFMFWFAGTKEAEWLGTSQVTRPEVIQTATSELSARPAERDRLIAQFDEIEVRAARHAKIMSFFYKQYYISISMIVGAAVLASICLFFISKVGWERVNNALINIFIFSSAVVFFHGNLMLVFKQEENLRGNQELYLSYLSVREEMLSYWATQQTQAGDTLEAAQFIHYIDGQLQGLNKIQLGFDTPQISTLVDQFQFNNPENRPTLQPSPQP